VKQNVCDKEKKTFALHGMSIDIEQIDHECVAAE